MSRDPRGELESAKECFFRCCPLATVGAFGLCAVVLTVVLAGAVTVVVVDARPPANLRVRTRPELEKAQLPALAIRLPSQAFEQLLGLIPRGLLTSARESRLPVGAGDEVTRRAGSRGSCRLASSDLSPVGSHYCR